MKTKCIDAMPRCATILPASAGKRGRRRANDCRKLLVLLSASTSMSASVAGADLPAQGQARKDDTGFGENWLLTQVRLFRAYPHLDRAYKLIAGNRLENAAQELHAYLDIETSDKNAYVTYLNTLYRMQRYDEVLHQAERLQELDSGNAQARLFKGLVFQARRQDDPALTMLLPLLGSAAADLPTREAAATAAVDVALRRGRFADALRALAVLQKEADTFAHRMREGAALAGLNRYPEARVAYTSALALAATVAQRRQVHQTAFYLAHKHGDVAQAQVHAQAVLDMDASDPTWVRALAMTYYLQKDQQRALATIARLPPASATADDHFFEANLRLAQSEFGAAASSFAQVVKESSAGPNRFRAYMGLGYALSGMHQMRRAAEAFTRAQQLQASDEATQALNNVSRMLADGETGGAHPGISHALYVKTAGNESGRVVSAETSPAKAADAGAVRPAPMPTPARIKPAHSVAPAATAASASPTVQAPAATETSEAIRQQALLDAAYAEVAGQNDAAAVIAFEKAVDEGVDTLQVYLDLGFAYTRLKRPDMARDSFLQGLRLERSARQLLYVARSYVATGQVEPALQYLGMVKAEQQALPVEERKAVLIETGNLLTKQEHFEAAAANFDEALSYGADGATLMSLAYVRETGGQADAALEALSRIDLASMPPAQAGEVRRRMARLYEKTGNVDLTCRALLDLIEADPSAANHYRLGVYEVAHARSQEGLTHLQAAREMEPDNPLYAEQLGYLYKNQGAYAQAAAMFEAAIEQRPADHRLYLDLAYTYKQMGDNLHAIDWFKRSIDAKYEEARQTARKEPDAAPSPPVTFDDVAPRRPGFMKVAYPARRSGDRPGEKTDAGGTQEQAVPSLATDADADASDKTSIVQGQDEDLYRMRKEVRDLSKRYQFNVYESYRSKSQPGGVASAQPGFFNSGAIPSQGGVELIYQPAGIGYQDGRIFQIFTRGLWSNQPDSLAIAHESLQASVGARYKPLKTQDMFISLERLIRIGDQSQNDWLARLSYAWSDGYELKPNQASWNQTTVYGDLGYFFPRSEVKALYAEVRQGRAFNFGNRVVVTPHVMLAGRSQRPDPGGASYQEAGAGVALKYLFNETRYEAERSSVDVWLQYRHSFAQQHTSGWVMTAALQF